MNTEKITNKLRTKFLARNIILFDSIDSTQSEAKRNNYPNGTVIIAEEQTKGKGTHGRVWYTDTKEKNIAMTFVLNPDVNVDKLKNVTITIAKCVLSTFKKLYNIELQIKSPNDIVINGKKIGGILSETKIVGQKAEKLYIGIGINVLQKKFNDEIKKIASSIVNEFNIECQREDIIAEFFNIFEKEYIKILEV